MWLVRTVAALSLVAVVAGEKCVCENDFFNKDSCFGCSPSFGCTCVQDEQPTQEPKAPTAPEGAGEDAAEVGDGTPAGEVELDGDGDSTPTAPVGEKCMCENDFFNKDSCFGCNMAGCKCVPGNTPQTHTAGSNNFRGEAEKQSFDSVLLVPVIFVALIVLAVVLYLCCKPSEAKLRRRALGLPDDATEEECRAAEGLKRRRGLGLADDATDAECARVERQRRREKLGLPEDATDATCNFHETCHKYSVDPFAETAHEDLRAAKKAESDRRQAKRDADRAAHIKKTDALKARTEETQQRMQDRHTARHLGATDARAARGAAGAAAVAGRNPQAYVDGSGQVHRRLRPKPCGKCGGDGRYLAQECNSCNGTGVWDGNSRMCQGCNGTGKYGDPRGPDCNICGGNGQSRKRLCGICLNDRHKRKICKACNQSGAAPANTQPCFVCEGTTRKQGGAMKCGACLVTHPGGPAPGELRMAEHKYGGMTVPTGYIAINLQRCIRCGGSGGGRGNCKACKGMGYLSMYD